MYGQSLRIIGLTWGRVEVEGGGTFKGAIFYPGGCQGWDRQVTGTDHSPGIVPADIEMLSAKGAAAVLLTLGLNGRLLVAPSLGVHWLTGASRPTASAPRRR